MNYVEMTQIMVNEKKIRVFLNKTPFEHEIVFVDESDELYDIVTAVLDEYGLINAVWVETDSEKYKYALSFEFLEPTNVKKNSGFNTYEMFRIVPDFYDSLPK